jgi:hypothetical protein
MKKKTTKYNFPRSFQIKVIALMARDPAFLAGYADAIDPSYFDNNECSMLATMVKDYWVRYTTTPSQEALEAVIADHCERTRTPAAIRADLFAAMASAMGADTSDRDFLLERVVAFGRRQAVKQTVVRVVELMDKDVDEDEFEGVVGDLQKSLLVGSGCSDLGFHFGQQALDIPQLVRGSKLYGSKVATKISTLDTCLHDGLAQGELGMVVGYTGRGKSVTLVNFAAAAIEAGLPVVYYTFELHEVDVALRLAARLTRTTTDEIVADDAEYYQKMTQLIMGTNGDGPKVRIKYWPPKTVRVSAIRSHLSRLKSVDGVVPALVLVDYADKLIGSRHVGETYGEMGDVCDGLIGIANDFEVPLWTASQVRREKTIVDKLDKPDYILDLDSIADSFRKATDADTVITLNQTRMEKDAGEIRLFTAKVRRGVDGRVIPCNIDYKRMLLEEGVEPNADESFVN